MRYSEDASPPKVVNTRLIPAAFDGMGQEGKILRATMECIVGLGIDRTTTHAIARKAHLKQGIIHYYFKSKDELLMRLLRVIFAESELIMTQIASSDASAREKVELILEAGRRFVVERHDVFIVYVAFWAHAMARGGRWKEAYKVLLDRLIGAIRVVIQSGERSGDFQKGTAGPAAALIVACVQGLGLQANIRTGIRQAIEIQSSFDAILSLFAVGANGAGLHAGRNGTPRRGQSAFTATAAAQANHRGAASCEMTVRTGEATMRSTSAVRVDARPEAVDVEPADAG